MDTSSESVLHSLQSTDIVVKTFSFSSCGQFLATCSAAGDIDVWNNTTFAKIVTCVLPYSFIATRVKFNKSSDQIVVSSTLGAILVVAWQDGTVIWRIPVELAFGEKKFCCFCGLNDSRVVYTCDSWMFLHDSKVLMEKDNSWESISFLEASPDGNLLAFTLYDTPMTLVYDISAEKWLHTFQEPAHPTDICFNKTGNLLLSCSKHTSCLWDVLTGRRIFMLHEKMDESDMDCYRNSGMQNCCFSEDGCKFFIGGLGKMVMVWDTLTGRALQRISTGCEVKHLAYRPTILGSYI